MKIGVYTDRVENSKTLGITGEIIFSPLYEMMASMHVICNPEHHTGRQKWFKSLIEKVRPKLLTEIQELGKVTNDYLIPMDFTTQMPFMELDITECLYMLKKCTMSKWNEIFESYGKTISVMEKNRIIMVMEEYYEEYFKGELFFLEPLLIRYLKKLMEQWKTIGIATSLDTFHERLHVEDEEIILYKNKEYHFPYEKLRSILVTGSTFLSPHLVTGITTETLHLVKHFYAESVDVVPPQELTKIYNGLADSTRLMILRCLKKAPDNTAHLAEKLHISEAAVSKQLKILYEGGLVEKKRIGKYVFYSISTETLDFLTYRIYEYLS